MSEWTTPKTWAIGELVRASDLNAQLRDNLSALKDPPSAHYTLDETADYQTTSTVFVDVDSTNLSFTLSTNGGDVLVHFDGTLRSGGTGIGVALDVAIDGVRLGGDEGLVVMYSSTGVMSFTRLVSGLSAGEHTFVLQWRAFNASSPYIPKMYTGAGTSGYDVHPQFWVREVS